MYDTIIIGARCAGSALALMLARSGLNVLVVERADFPSDTMSGHYIHPAGVSCLRRLGLMERLDATGTPALHRMTVDFGAVALTGTPRAAPDGTVTGYAPRRYLFDQMLAEAAIEAGAAIHHGMTFRTPLFENERVVGITCVDRHGAGRNFKAKVVIGADGWLSRFAKSVGSETYNECPVTTCTYYAYWDGFDANHPHLFIRDGRFFVAVPTNHGQTFMAVAWPVAEFRHVRKDIDKAYRAAVSEVPWIAERLQNARQVGQYIGTSNLDGFFRKPCGPGWALVGDAGYHKDPITAQGMTDALLHAEMLSQAIIEGLGGNLSLDSALTRYHLRRDESATPMYALTNDLARLAPPTADMQALVGALTHNPLATRDFLGVMAGTMSVKAFFSPNNMEAIFRPVAA